MLTLSRLSRLPRLQAFETHDPKTGELIRHNPDDDTTTLVELVRQERFSAGAADQKNMDAEIADRIARDGRYDNSLDYVDEHAERLARKKMKTDVMKKAFAVQGGMELVEAVSLSRSLLLMPLLFAIRLCSNEKSPGQVSCVTSQWYCSTDELTWPVSLQLQSLLRRRRRTTSCSDCRPRNSSVPWSARK